MLDGSKLYYLKNDSSRQKMLICDVMLCTVKVGFLLFSVGCGGGRGFMAFLAGEGKGSTRPGDFGPSSELYLSAAGVSRRW